MIPSTARHGYRALSSTSYSAVPIAAQLVIPAAESSTHALQRAIQQQRLSRACASHLQSRSVSGVSRAWKGKGVRRSDGERSHYSTAVALHAQEDDVEPERGARGIAAGPSSNRKPDDVAPADWPDDTSFPFHRYTPPDSSSSLPYPTRRYSLSGPQVIRAPTADENPLLPYPSPAIPTESTWRTAFLDMVDTQPLLAFLCLHAIPDEALRILSPKNLDRLFLRLTQTNAEQSRFLSKVDRGDAGDILIRIRTYLCSLPEKKSSKKGYVPGSRLRGRRLRYFLSCCVYLRRDDIARDTFCETFPSQVINDISSVEELEKYAQFLSGINRHQLLIDTIVHEDFPASKPNVHVSLWTPTIFSAIATAYLSLRIPGPVVRLGDTYRHLKRDEGMTPSVYTHLLQANVALGKHEEAKSIRKAIKKMYGESDGMLFDEQVAILQGQKALGFDKQLELKILQNLPRNPLQSARLIHRLIQLRLNNGDTEGARTLLARFDLTLPMGQPSSGAKLPPTPSTILIAFEIISRSPNLEQLRAWWNYFQANPVLLSDHAVAMVIRSMSTLGLVDEAHEMVRSRVLEYEPISRVWRLPASSEVDITTMNALTACMSEYRGLRGLRISTDLMRQSNIGVDGATLKVILDAIREHMFARPQDLAELLKAMLERARNVRAQIGHIDSIMAEAVKLASSPHVSASLSATTLEDLRDPAVGLTPIAEFAETVEVVLKSLRNREVGSSSTSLASRLQFEALLGGEQGQLPKVDLIWERLMNMGYRLSHRHMRAIMQGYADAGQMRQAEKVPTLARQAGIKPTSAMYMVLLRGWAKSNAVWAARKAYDSMSPLGSGNPDLIATTAMVGAYCRVRWYHSAVELVRRDMLGKDHFLDDKAVLVGMTALRWTGDELGALDLLEKRKSITLNFYLRRAVRRIRVHILRKIAQRRATSKEHAALIRVDDILHADIRARPFIAKDSLFTPPKTERVPRWYHHQDDRPRLEPNNDLANMVSSTHDTSLEPNLTSSQITQIRSALGDRRIGLESELLEVSAPIGETMRLSDLTEKQTSRIDRELEGYERELVRAFLPKRSVRSANVRRRRGTRVSWARKRRLNAQGRVETLVKTRLAAERREEAQKQGGTSTTDGRKREQDGRGIRSERVILDRRSGTKSRVREVTEQRVGSRVERLAEELRGRTR